MTKTFLSFRFSNVAICRFMCDRKWNIMKFQEFDKKNMFFTTLSHFTSGFSSSAHFEDAVLLQKVQNQFKNWLYIAELVHLPISAFPSWTLIQIFYSSLRQDHS